MECLILGCQGKARCRGLCNNCYVSARNKVRAGGTTWDELVEMELAAKVKYGGNGKSLFQIALEKAKAEIAEGKY